MTTYLARERQSVFVEEEELETSMSSPTDTEGIVVILAQRVCDHVGRRRFVIRKGKNMALGANVMQYVVMRAVQEKYRELHEAIEHMNERHGKHWAMMERKEKLMSGALKDLRENKLQEIRDLDN